MLYFQRTVKAKATQLEPRASHHLVVHHSINCVCAYVRVCVYGGEVIGTGSPLRL